MIKKICVAGAGTMGSGIAQVAAAAGFNTILFDPQSDALDRAATAIKKSLGKLVEKEKITTSQSEAICARIEFVNDVRLCVADIVIEAIVEILTVKTSLFNQLAVINDAATIFASNTSSLSLSMIQKQVVHPERVVGMHFFNPAPVMKLVEVVKGEQTADVTVQTVLEIVKKMGKVPVICRDAPGFIVNRVARPYYLEAMKIVENGLANIETVDGVMQASGFKMGPFKLMDLIGLDVNYAVSCSVYEQMGMPLRLQPSPIQQQKVQDGKFGIKKGEGFYLY